MQIIGLFSASNPPNTDDGRALKTVGVKFLSCPSGDWYELQKTAPPGRVAMVEAGKVVSVTDDITSIFPKGCTVIADVPQNIAKDWLWDGSQFTAPPAQGLPTTPTQSVQTVSYGGRTYLLPELTRLSLAVNLANAAISAGVRGGDMRWLDRNSDFTWPAIDGTEIPMDAPTLVAFAAAVYAA